MKLSAIRPIALVLSRELVITGLLLLGVSFVVFIILFVSPGDPFSVLLEGQLSIGEAKAGLHEAMGAPRSWYVQYLAWLAGMLSGNFGTSIRMGLPVLPEVLRVGLSTLILTIGSLIITLLIAVPIALYSARRGTNKISWPLTMFSYVISALPVFWLGYIVIYFFTHKLGLFPIAFGFSTAGQKYRWLYQLLPIFVLGVGNGTISEVIRFLRQEMARVMSEDYIRTARAKGASVWKHAYTRDRDHRFQNTLYPRRRRDR
jgi:peptide/nickel transport system permease protein